MRAVVALLLLVAAFAGCSEGARDTDGDTLRDSTEKDWPDLIVDYLDRRVRLEGVTSDEGKADTDGDGLGDFDEFFSKTDPRDEDTDDDGLTDCQETVHRNAEECADPTYEGTYDGGYRTTPTRADSDPGPGSHVNRPGHFRDETDTLGGLVEWGDGISDGDEVLGLLLELPGGRQRTVVTDPRDIDSDGDGLEDGDELLLFNSDATVPNTDGDACGDAQDAWPDRAETYALGLKTFFLKRDLDSSGSDLVLSGQVVGIGFVAPPTGSIHVERGSTSIAFLDPPASQATDCPVSALDPWAKLQLAAVDPDGTSNTFIDIASLKGPDIAPGSLATLWWNVRTGSTAYIAGGQPIGAPVRLEGLDAWIEFEPSVQFSQGS